jgi:hypothetical protein
VTYTGTISGQHDSYLDLRHDANASGETRIFLRAFT